MSQPYFCEGSDAMVDLETMVDRVGLNNVLYALAHICRAKGEHLRAAWQDATTANVWDKNAVALDRVQERLIRT
jgi:hypothetical protein